MPRTARGDLGDGVFHVTARGNAGDTIFSDHIDCRAFLALLARAADRASWRIHAYCLMPNHFHLVVESAGPALSTGMRLLNGGYAQHFNERHDRYGHLFQGRFAARMIEGDSYFTEACQYVVENPVRAGLCERVEDYPWSALFNGQAQRSVPESGLMRTGPAGSVPNGD